MKLLVTGVLGFIGSNFIIHVLTNYPSYKIVNVDDEHIGSNHKNLMGIKNSTSYRFVKGNITDRKLMSELILNCDVIINFAAISGDYNPIHTNHEYASKTDFGNRLCHGMLLASFFSRLIGMYIPGKNALYFSQSLNFRNPCFINDEVIVTGIVIEKRSSTKMIKLKTIIKNLKGQVILDGEAKAIIRK